MMAIRVEAQEIRSVRYLVSWPEPQTHYYHVQMDIERSDDGPVDVRLPSWRPGRYLIQNYPRYVVDFEAMDEEGNPLPFAKTDKGTWRVDAGREQKVTVRHRNYANVLDAGESYLDETEAYINPITVAMYVPGAEMTPSVIAFDKPESWKVATALEYDEEEQGYPVSSYHELVDSPFIISPDWEMHAFEYDGATYELVFQGEGNYDPDTVIEDVRSITEAQLDVMQVTPFDRYVYLYHLLPYPFGHGVEHKNSTSIVLGPTDFDDRSFYYRFLGLTSHELFHVWNVERIRPEAIYHPDYSQEQYTTTMWIYEGITSYYTTLTIARAGLRTPEQYLSNLASLLRRYDASYGRRVTSVAMTSWDSWTSSDAPPNTTYSFYAAGNVLGLLLDLEIRGRTGNEKSLDHVFRYLYEEYAEKDRGVPEDGFERALETVAGSSFQPFFDAYVYGKEEIDYNAFLAHAGLVLEKDDAGQAPSIGFDVVADDEFARIRRVKPGSMAEKLGLSTDDLLLTLDGSRITDDNFEALLNQYDRGDTVALTYFEDELMRTVEITLEAGQPAYSIARDPDRTAQQEAIYDSWLGRYP